MKVKIVLIGFLLTLLGPDAGAQYVSKVWVADQGNGTYRNPVLKWDTDRWGEIPADFGRK